jgi:hypothetical protein
MSMNKTKTPNARKHGLVVQHVKGETLVYDLNVHKAFCLNKSAAIVWKYCDGSKSVEEIVSSIKAAGEVDFNTELVEFALMQLENESLLESKGEFQPIEPGISRRQTIRRLGLASAFAIPIVAAIVAPPAANAQSCIANNNPCTTSSQCCSTCCKDVGGGVNQCKPGGGACLP